MNTFTVLSTGHTSAYPCHYARPWLLVPSHPRVACGWWPARVLTPHESYPRVTPFRVSILCDRRVVLYAGSRSGEYQVSAWQPGLRPFPFGPAVQPLGRVCMTTPQPHLYSSLPLVTCSTGRRARLAAYRLSFPLSTRAYQFRAEGRCCLSFTREARVDVRCISVYHRTCMDTQLSKACPEQREGSATFAAHPPRPMARFRANGSHHAHAADRRSCANFRHAKRLGIVRCGG
jgi:hypothetical protein